MFKIIATFASILFVSGLNAAESKEHPVNAAPQLDTMQACYLKGIPYSKGMIEKVGDREFECERGVSSNGFRTDGMPLEWVEVPKA